MTPATLQKPMLHASIETTLNDYLENNADDVSAAHWAAAGSILSITSPRNRISRQ